MQLAGAATGRSICAIRSRNLCLFNRSYPSFTGPHVPLLRHASGTSLTSSPCPGQLSRLSPRNFSTQALRAMSPDKYQDWSREQLIEEVQRLTQDLQKHEPSAPPPAAAAEASLSPASASSQPKSSSRETQAGHRKGQPITTATTAAQNGVPKKPKVAKTMDPSKYASRFIALKLAYLGKNYGGFEYAEQANLPSIEGELWKALTKACLIFPEDESKVDFSCCEYSKCGRTDRGVSAFGQVIGLRVRSSRPMPKKETEDKEGEGDARVHDPAQGTKHNQETESDTTSEKPPWDPIWDELPYTRLLNRLLPNDIRILAWCPSPPPDFSARFSCRERQYRYFFTQPALSPEPTSIESDEARRLPVKPGWLDIDAMRDAAKRFEGDQDFRNVCKVDYTKLISNFRRVIFESDIAEVQDVSTALPYLGGPEFSWAKAAATNGSDGVLVPKVYYFHVRGSAFLWHQIRHMVAILFLVGQGLEKPEIVSELLDVGKNPRKPGYAMADEVPLVLWDCIFPDLDLPPAERNGDSLGWVWAGEENLQSKYGQLGVATNVWEVWRAHKMDEILSSQLLRQVTSQGSLEGSRRPPGRVAASTKVFEGGNVGRLGGKYKNLLKRDMQETPDEVNDRYARRKGYANADDMRAQKGYRKGTDLDAPE